MLGRDRRVETTANDYSEATKPKFKDVEIVSFCPCEHKRMKQNMVFIILPSLADRHSTWQCEEGNKV